jgi:hypothetical protein
LRPYIDRENLKQLVVKTMKFLAEVADHGSALMTDLKILDFAARKMGFLPEPEPTSMAEFPMVDPSSSFSTWSETTPRPEY